MTDLTLKFDFTDRGGAAVYDVIGHTKAAQMPVLMGQVRIPPDPRIAELEAQQKTCKWTKTVMGNYGEYDDWATECGEDFAIEEEWHERPTKFCANCGGKTVETGGDDDDDDDE